jgi:hypothetical protein
MSTTNQSKDIVIKRALKLVRQNKKKFYKLWWKEWSNQVIERNHQYGDQRWHDLMNNYPSRYLEYQAISKIMGTLGVFDMEKFPGWGYNETTIIWGKYRQRFITYMTKRANRNGGRFPHENKTRAVKEFLNRGFKHVDDYVMDLQNCYYVKCNIAPLIWPDEFDNHQDAMEVQAKMGIPGYTGTIIPKKHK